MLPSSSECENNMIPIECVYIKTVKTKEIKKSNYLHDIHLMVSLPFDEYIWKNKVLMLMLVTTERSHF